MFTYSAHSVIESKIPEQEQGECNQKLLDVLAVHYYSFVQV